MLAADNIQDLLEAADRAQEKYDSLFYFPDTTTISITPSPSGIITLVPNPMNEQVHIHSNQPILSIEILDIMGKQILEIQRPNNQQVVLTKNHLPNPGTYFIMINTNNNVVVEKLLVF